MKYNYKNPVQNNVGSGSNHQILQCFCRISHRIQNSCGIIINDGKQHSTKKNPHIKHRLRQHFLWCSHPVQKYRSCRYANRHHDKSENNCDCNSCVNSFLYSSLIFGTILLRDHNSRTHRCPNTKCQQQIDQCTTGPDCRECMLSYIISYDNRIDRVIKLLK